MQHTINSPFIPKLSPHDDEEDQLDSLSLRDLPLTSSRASPTFDLDDHPRRHNPPVNHSRRSSSSSYSDPTSDFFFEFLINNDDDLITSAADDVIFHGRLLPFSLPPPLPPRPRRSLSLSSAAARLTRSQLTESPAESLPTIRPSRSLNYRKLHRNRLNSKRKSEILHRNHSSNNDNNSHRCHSEKLPPKSPWYWLVFGLPVKIPAEMELKDIKNRRIRRSTPPSTVFSGGRSCSSASWKFLNVLSCKSHATVDVTNTAPLRNSLI